MKWLRRSSGALFVVFGVGVSAFACAPGAGTRSPSPPAAEVPATTSASAVTKAEAPPASAPAGDIAAGETKPSPSPAAQPKSEVVFPPPAIQPPATKTAASGDGVWSAFGDASLGERAAAGPFIARTVLHPHPDSRFVTVTIAAVDLDRVALHLVPGTEDALWAKRPANEPSGLVPAEDRDRLLAVMNGGFQPKHGRWGLVAGDVAITEPRDDGCTLAVYRDGTVRLSPWPKLSAARAQIHDIRQTPPCLVDEGAVHPALLRNDDKRWAGHAADLTTRRRSAVGLDATGRILFYAIGEEAAPRWLAVALKAAGAASAAEFDINWYWTRFLLFGTPSGEPLQVTSTLIPKMEHLKRGYVERPSTRDFFYLVERR